MPRTPSRVVHLELHTSDRQAARDLYRELCGWDVEEIESRYGSYAAIELGDKLGGGIVECHTHQALWLPYVEVDDVFQATDRAVRAGASLLLSPREGPAGWRSVVATPVGGEIAFWQPKERSSAD